MKLEPELRESSMPEAAGKNPPASQVVRKSRSFIEPRRQDGAYDDYLNDKIEFGRASVRAGRGRPNDEVEATFAAKRKEVSRG